MSNEELKELVKEKLQKIGIVFTLCRSCGEEIFFFPRKNKSSMPMNLDLTPHWTTCPEAESFRNKIKQKEENNGE